MTQPVSKINQQLLKKGYIGGYDLEPEYGFENTMLIAVTEQRTKEEIEHFIEVLEGLDK